MPGSRPTPASAGYAKNPSISITSIISTLNAGNARTGVPPKRQGPAQGRSPFQAKAAPDVARHCEDVCSSSRRRGIHPYPDDAHMRAIATGVECLAARTLPWQERQQNRPSRHASPCLLQTYLFVRKEEKSGESQAWACSAASAASSSAIRASISTLRSIGRIGGTTRVLCMESSTSTNAESGMRDIRGIEIGRVAAS